MAYNPKGIARKVRNDVERIVVDGALPLEVGLKLMRHYWSQAYDKSTDKVVNELKAELAADLANKFAPFVHPKFAAIEASVEHGGEITHVVSQKPLTEAEWIQQHARKNAVDAEIEEIPAITHEGTGSKN